MGIGVGNTGDFQHDRGWQIHAKLYRETTANVWSSVSFFWADHSGNPTGFPGIGSKLFRLNRAGGPYAAVLGAGNDSDRFCPAMVSASVLSSST